jgi:hypothetical protein
MVRTVLARPVLVKQSAAMVSPLGELRAVVRFAAFGFALRYAEQVAATWDRETTGAGAGLYPIL